MKRLLELAALLLAWTLSLASSLEPRVAPRSEGCGGNWGRTIDLPEVCGDGVRGVDEVCDQDDVGWETCHDQGLGPGLLRCKADCQDFDRTGCGAPDTCGDGEVQGVEKCDGENLEERTCRGLGYAAGDLGCSENCAEYDVTGCFESTDCGDGLINHIVEVCDDRNFGGLTCQLMGYRGGELSCQDHCTTIDRSACHGYVPDGGSADSGSLDRTAPDAAVADAALEDAVAEDAVLEDVAMEDAGIGDAPAVDGGYTDSADPCLGVSETGQCSGSQLQFCRDRQLVEVDCAGPTTTCGESASGVISCVGVAGAVCIDAQDCLATLSCANHQCQ